jgi:hypothetical protein
MDVQNIFSGALKGLVMGNAPHSEMVYLTENVATLSLAPVSAMVNTGEDAGKFSLASAEIEIAETDPATIAILEGFVKNQTYMHLVLLKGYVDETEYNEWTVTPVIWNLEITRAFGSDLQKVIIKATQNVEKESDIFSYQEIIP